MKKHFVLLFFVAVTVAFAAGHDPVIAVRRSFTPDADRCLQALKARSCLVKALLTKGADHYDYEGSVNVPLSRARSIEVTAREDAYQVKFIGEAGVPADEIKTEIRRGLALYVQGTARAYIQIYRQASPAEAALPPGTVVASSSEYEEKTFGRAIGARRRIAVRAEDCAKKFASNRCDVAYLAKDDPDHPGPPYAELVSTFEHSFPDGSSLLAESDEEYHGFVLTYTPAHTDEAEVTKLAKIKQALGPARYLSVYVFTPEDPAKLTQEAYASGAIIDEKIDFAVYATEMKYHLSAGECEQAFDTATLSCVVRQGGQPILNPPTLFAHTTDFQTFEISLGARGMVEFSLLHSPDGYRVKLSSPEIVDVKEAIARVEAALNEVADREIGWKKMMVFEPF